jgi:F0F1-type ATP synthase membrane subunit b/b'
VRSLDHMFWFFVLVVVVVLAVAAYKFRVPLLAKLLGQPESRIQQALDRRKQR